MSFDSSLLVCRSELTLSTCSSSTEAKKLKRAEVRLLGKERKALWPRNVCIYDSWHVICSLWLCAIEFLGLLNYPKQFPFGHILSPRGTSFKQLFPKAGWHLAGCSHLGRVPPLAECDSRGCLVGLSRIRYQSQCSDIQTYGLSTETSSKSAVNIGNSRCWPQLRSGSQKCPTIGPEVSSPKPFFSPSIFSHLLLNHVNSQFSDSAQRLCSSNSTWVGSTPKDKAIQNQLICQAGATVQLNSP